MLTQVSALEAVTVYCLDYCPQQSSKLLGNTFQFCVQGVFQQIIVDIANDMYDALLLLAGERIICRIEVGDQNAGEGMEHLLEKRSLPGWLVKVIHFVHAGQHPDIAF